MSPSTRVVAGLIEAVPTSWRASARRSRALWNGRWVAGLRS